jgi:hypothetical protein
MKITIDFSGWVSIDAKEVVFTHVFSDEKINGEEYYQLPESEREFYHYSFEDVLKACDDSDFTTDIEFEEDSE